MARRLVLVLLVLVALVGCGGPEEAEPFVTATEQTRASDRVDQNEQPSSSRIVAEGNGDAVASSTDGSANEQVSQISSEQAIESYDRFVDDLEIFMQATLVSRDATAADAERLLANIDPIFIAGEVNEAATLLHDCVVDDPTDALGDVGITALEIEVDYLSAFQIDESTWVLETLRRIDIDGEVTESNESHESTIIVTVDGVGPSLGTFNDDAEQCPIFSSSPAAHALVDEVAAVVGLAD